MLKHYRKDGGLIYGVIVQEELCLINIGISQLIGKQTPNLIWQVLTKRSDRIKDNLPKDWGNGYSNVWLGTSVENNDYVFRAKELIESPAIVHFISYEPALSAIPDLDLTDIEWVIYGGESGNNYREDSPDWAREVRDKCLKNKVAFFYKQGSYLRPGHNTELDGKEWKQFPKE